MLYGHVCSPQSQKYDRPSLSSDVIGKELRADRLSKPSCLGFGFEGLDFVTDALVSSAPYPFRFERQWLENIGDAAELDQAQFCAIP